jgi:hypothetical protein
VDIIPSWYNESTPGLKNMSDYWQIGGSSTDSEFGEKTNTIGTIELDAYEVATFTLDMSRSETNMTYGDHYVIAVYVNCKPCPTRYLCDYAEEPPVCSFPSLERQQELYDNCLMDFKLESCIMRNGSKISCDDHYADLYPGSFSFMEPDLHKCRELPYFCEDMTYPKLVWDIQTVMVNGNQQAESVSDQEESSYVEDDDWRLYTSNDFYDMTKGCCQCERHSLPYYFADTTAVGGFPDNKHTVHQISIMAVEQVELTVVVELLNGIFYNEFDKYIPDKGDFFIHTPGRAKYTPSNPSRAAFVAVIVTEEFEGMELPLNLPLDYYRLPNELIGGETGVRFENHILINRNADLVVGDPEYHERNEERERQNYFDFLRTNPNSTLEFEDFATSPDIAAITEELTVTVDNYRDNYQSADWLVVGDDSGENDFLGLPYFPFFSNCKGFDSYMSISKMLETHPDCDIIPYEKTKAVDQYIWNNQLTPNADSCVVEVPEGDARMKIIDQEEVEWFGAERGAVMECMFEEQIDIPAGNPRWFEMEAGESIFYITKEPVSPHNYEPVYRQNEDYTRNYTSRWGRSDYIAGLVDTFKLIPISVDELNGGLDNVVPRQVKLEISYYQVEKGYKRLVEAMISYVANFQCHVLTSGSSDQRNLEKQGIPQCVTDFNGNIATSEYQLEIVFTPLVWFELLNKFEFTADVYMFFFTLVGLISILVAMIVWAINRALTRLRHPPPFHGYILYTIISEAPIFGCTLACIPVFIGAYWVSIWLTSFDDGGTFCSPDPVNLPSTTCFEDIAGDWSDSLTLNLDRINHYRVGRQGTCFLGMGLYITFLSARLIVPKWSDEHGEDDMFAEEAVDTDVGNGDEDEVIAPSPIWAPMVWKRAHLMLASFLLELLMMCLIEFSFSATFGDWVYQIIIGYKIFQKYMDIVFEDLLKEFLLINPLATLYTVIEGLITMGADSFSDFILSYFVELCVMVIERCYLDPGIGEISKLWPRWEMQMRRYFGSNRRMTREEKADEELEWRRINEEIELESEGIEPLLDSYSGYSTEVTGLFVFPIINVILLIFYSEIQIAPMYGILENQMIYYILFSFYIVPFMLAMDVFLLNTQELIHGWKVYDYISYQKYRFSVREHRWMLHSTLLDESISEGFQTLDMLCFSSQYYFIMTLFTFGMMFIILAMVIYLRNNYNPFADPIACLLIVLMIIGGELLGMFLKRLGDVKILRLGWRGLWVTKQIEGTVDDDVAAKLAIGEGRQQDLEQERMELQALNSDRFRHRFLERNRPWILQHLVELITPRSLENAGHDGRPVVEYVRDVYADLMAMGEGMKRAGDREDISSDDDDELEDARRNWSRVPLEGPNLSIARMWLAKARKRRAFMKLVRGIIDSHVKTACEICGRTPQQNNVKLFAHLATNGKPDPHAIDRLMAMFEEHYSVDELDPQIWKAFFRAHAEYATRCTVCEDAIEQQRLGMAGREPGGDRVTRPDDISSDDEGDDKIFDPMVVNRHSSEGRMMSKWLGAARKKLGGSFPRDDARKQMEKYAQKMRQLKIKQAKEAVGKAVDREQQEEDMKKALQEEFGDVDVDAATRALAQRWVRLAKESIEVKFRTRSENIRTDLAAALEDMPEQDDWYFGGEMRVEGKQLLTRGLDLSNDRKTLEAEATIKIRKVEADLQDFLERKVDKMKREREEFELKIAEGNDASALKIETRSAELEKAKQDKRKEFDGKEKTARDEMGAAPTEMVQAHRAHIAELDAQARNETKRARDKRSDEVKVARTNFDRSEALQKDEVAHRKGLARDNLDRIRTELAGRIKASESDWQTASAKWLMIAQKKIEVKKREDTEAKKVKKKR